MELHVIRPTYNCDNEENEFRINGFIDEQGNKLTIEDLLNVKNDVKYYCYAYQPLIAYLQTHLNRSGYIQKKSTTASYSGRPKKQKAYFACHLVSSPNPNATPLTKQFKVFEMEKAIYFLNIEKWFTGLSVFHIPEEEVEKCFKILMKIEEILIPEYLEKGRVGRVP